MVELDILNPVAELKTAEKIKTAPKLRNLNGKRVGLFWNQKPGGDLILAQTAEQLKRTYSGLIFQNYLGERSASVTVAQIEAVVKDECDAVIASTAD